MVFWSICLFDRFTTCLLIEVGGCVAVIVDDMGSMLCLSIIDFPPLEMAVLTYTCSLTIVASTAASLDFDDIRSCLFTTISLELATYLGLLSATT